MAARKQAIKDNVDSLKDKLVQLGKDLTAIGEADTQRALDLVAADKARETDLKEKLDGQMAKLKSKRTAVQKLRNTMANAKSAAEKADLLAQVDSQQFEADMIQKDFE